MPKRATVGEETLVKIWKKRGFKGFLVYGGTTDRDIAGAYRAGEGQ